MSVVIKKMMHLLPPNFILLLLGDGVCPLLLEVQLAIQAWINVGLGKGSPAPQILTLWGAHNTPSQEVGAARMRMASRSHPSH